ncbi:MAG: class I SAM-dependent methyltransferase [Planctomycetota bacterium]|nr:class I SAM-dependent methyltransferase [Planctomycetota bacterium]
MDIKEQAGKVLTQIAGYVGVRVLDVGLRSGLLREMEKSPEGISAAALAENLGLDPFYVSVWCRGAYASELIDLRQKLDREGYDPQTRRFQNPAGQTFVLAPHMAELLLDEESPAYVGGLPNVLLQPEIFDSFAKSLASGEHMWWDQCSPEFIQGVSGTGGPFYARLLQGGLERVPELSDVLKQSPRIMVLCCGAGRGIVRMARTYPEARFIGVDGDRHSLELAAQRVSEAGLEDRITFVETALEDLDQPESSDVVLINISMHECRDITKTTENVRRALRPGGFFVISDFPFPDSTGDCRTVPARIMSGIQFFEAQIDDQLMPTRAFVELLETCGFEGVGSFDITPVHAVTYGRRSAI